LELRDFKREPCLYYFINQKPEIMKENNKIIAVRCSDFDYKEEERPYAVVLDIYDRNDNYVEQGTDWNYFKTENEAEEFINFYNTLNK